MPRPAHIDIDTAAIRANTQRLVAVADGATVCAVVKADGYGHGAVRAAHAALEGGAGWLAVALVEEGRELRLAGIEAPVLVLSEPVPDAMAEAHAAGLTPTLYTHAGVDAAAEAVRLAGATTPWEVHLKVDTGMHRVGALPADALDVARRIAGTPELALTGTFTHLAVADEPGRAETAAQLEVFDGVLAELDAAGIDPGVRHAANSAGTIAHPAARRDMVRVGIALYGVAPSPELDGCVALEPAMSLRSRVTLTKALRPGDGISYGLRHVVDRDAAVAVVPLGYADGVARNLGLSGGEVLIGGARRPIRGVVTMDQLVVEVTDGPVVRVGDEVVLLGRQGDEEIRAQDWAELLGTIAYEVVCGFAPRVPRRTRGEATR